MIETARVRLRPWRERDRAPLAAMHSDEEVMADYGAQPFVSLVWAARPEMDCS